MKQLLSLSEDFILDIRFYPDRINEEIDFIDPEKTIANGKQYVDNISMLLQLRDENGYYSETYKKIFLNKSDILALAEKIKELESIKLTGEAFDNLPF